MAAHWTKVIGRVSFVNCDPLYHALPDSWSVLPAPPAWLTGHLLRRDCLTAPIPTADYAAHHDELQLLKGLGILSDGPVGSVLLFSTRPKFGNASRATTRISAILFCSVTRTADSNFVKFLTVRISRWLSSTWRSRPLLKSS